MQIIGDFMWNNQVKIILKTELVRKGITHSRLSELMLKKGIEETKSSIDSKISRGTFSAAFFIQSLTVIGCKSIEIDQFENDLYLIAEKPATYKVNK